MQRSGEIKNKAEKTHPIASCLLLESIHILPNRIQGLLDVAFLDEKLTRKLVRHEYAEDT